MIMPTSFTWDFNCLGPNALFMTTICAIHRAPRGTKLYLVQAKTNLSKDATIEIVQGRPDAPSTRSPIALKSCTLMMDS